MNQTAVIYESRYGYTKRYAQWIAKALSCPLYERKKFHPKKLSDFQIILYGGGLYAGGVNGIRFLKQNENLLAGKKVILFTCGLADPDNPDNISNIKKSLGRILSKEQQKQLAVFHLRGGIDYSRLSFVHKAMMSMLCRMLQKKAPAALDKDGRMLLKTYGKHIDMTDKKSIQPLVSYVSGLQHSS